MAITLTVLAVPGLACTRSRPHFPTGSYTTTMTTADAPPSSRADSTAAGPGEWTIVFGNDGRLQVRHAGQTVVEADYTVRGDQFTISNETGPEACTEEGPGTYRWQTKGGALVATVLNDACAGRVTVFTKHPLVKR